ncbi:ABC transporter permease [Aggregatibacter actinomycetemcomitans]|uniref:ABC transporter permease n=1 Tax=Aggregatibacter actinomycetemcomitans TaxID=714 RepID=UPI00077E6BD6|nr:ABC transporter permease [Aggregatibacter actinomycetemcomitans]KYK72254.1 ABC transporter permease [Aggregatibacter actinomycetemcomitans serotype e str. SA3096]KYK96552.1 ABC transporter permease [Aggregatibacter actinomycetemcomitans serotype e str. ANH9776]TYB21999.1 ABC transporter permease [Aggregatibacter actinomycetemcomitans]
MLARMLFQSWRYGLKRKLLAIVTIFLAAGLISALLAVSIGIGDKMVKELKSYGANILVEPASSAILPDEVSGNNSLATQNFLDEKELPNIKDIFWRNNIVGFAPLLGAQVSAKAPNGNEQDINILGTFFDHQIAVPDEEDYHTGQKIISPYWQVEGEWVNDATDDFGDQIPALLGTQLAKQHQWKIGDTLALRYQQDEQAPQQQLKVIVKGIVKTGGTEEQQLILPLSAVQNLLGLEGKIQAVKVSALTVPENDLSRKARANVDGLAAEEYDRWYCTAYVSSISHQLEEAISGAIVRPIWQVAASEGVVIEKIQLLLAVVTLAALIAAAMGIASLMTTTIIERSKEIGLMKALGAYQWQIVLLFYCEAIISGFIGGMLGCIAGWGLARFIGATLFGAPLSFAWIVVPCVLVISVLIAVIGAWFPAHRIARLYPIEVLYGRQ